MIWLGHTTLLMEDCEDAWNESVHGSVTSTVNASDYLVGSNSASLTLTAPIASGNLLATEVVSLDLSTYTHMVLMIKASVNQAAGALVFCLDEDASCASPSESLALPALVANQWTACPLTFAAAASTRNATISVGLKTGATVANGTVILIDDVRAMTARQFNPLAVRGLNRPDDVLHSKAKVSELIDGDMYETVPVKSRRIITLEFNALSSQTDQAWLEAFMRKSDKRIIGANDCVRVVCHDAGGYTQDWLNGVSLGRRPVLKFVEKSGWSTQPPSWGYA